MADQRKARQGYFQMEVIVNSTIVNLILWYFKVPFDTNWLFVGHTFTENPEQIFRRVNSRF